MKFPKDQVRMKPKDQEWFTKELWMKFAKESRMNPKVKNNSPKDHEWNSLKNQRMKLKNQEAEIHIQEKSKPEFASKTIPKRKRRKEH